MSRFHADLHILASVAADPVGGGGNMSGGILLYDPQGAQVIVRKLMVSTDTAMRIVVGVGDQDGQRIRGASYAANGGSAPDVCVDAAAKIYIFRSATGIVDVSIDGDVIDA